MKNALKVLAALVFGAGLLSGSGATLAAQEAPGNGEAAEAALVRIVSFDGEIEVTLPDGTVTRYSAGQVIPPVPEGARIRVVTGTATLNVAGVRGELKTGAVVRFENIVVTPDRQGFTMHTEEGDPDAAELYAGDMRVSTDAGDVVDILLSPVRREVAVTARQGQVATSQTGQPPVTLQPGQSTTGTYTPPPPPGPPVTEPREPAPVEASPYQP